MTENEIKNKQFKTVEEINKWLLEMQIYNYQINADLSVDAFSHVELKGKGLKYLPINFNYANHFDCSENELTSLIGTPKTVQGDFRCNNNKLISLENGPLLVKCDYDCSSNQITSLQGSPERVVNFDCHSNKLITLEGGPQTVPGDYNCSHNQLTNLQYSPNRILNFYCNNNNLSSLDNSPQIVEGHYYCSHNKITTLKGCAPKIGIAFLCENNPLINLDDGPKQIGGKLKISNTEIKVIPKKIKFYELVHVVNSQAQCLSNFKKHYQIDGDKLLLNLTYKEFRKIEKEMKDIMIEKMQLEKSIDTQEKTPNKKLKV